MLYIAYIGTKGTNRMNVGLLLIATERKQKVPTKKETIYITIYSKERKRVKTATKGHKKRGLKNSPLK